MKTIQDIKHLPIRAYLAERGLHPTKDNPRYGLYLSPLRDERTPSFKVDYMQNLWYDFGLGTGGSIIDLVMRLERCDFTRAIRLLSDGDRTPIPASVSSSVALPAFTLRIIFDTPLRHPALVGYISSRGIDPNMAFSYCREVHYAINGREILLSDSAMMPEVGNCVPNASRAVYLPSTLQQSTMVPIPLSHLRALWISSPSSR